MVKDKPLLEFLDEPVRKQLRYSKEDIDLALPLQDEKTIQQFKQEKIVEYSKPGIVTTIFDINLFINPQVKADAEITKLCKIKEEYDDAMKAMGAELPKYDSSVDSLVFHSFS